MSGAVWAIVVAGGDGRRFGSAKQFESLAGRSVAEWSVAGARSVADAVVLVVPAGREGDVSLRALADVVVAGGASRAGSVRCGLSAVPEQVEVIVVHDAARPLASRRLFESVVGAVSDGADGAVPGIVVADTVKRVAGGVVAATLDRTELVRVQTPQAFRADALRKAHAGDPEATDDAALVEANGGIVRVVTGEDGNLKITSREDLRLAEWLLQPVSEAL